MGKHRRMMLCILVAWVGCAPFQALLAQDGTPGRQTVEEATMQRIYEEAKTPFKYGVVLSAPPGKKVDCPNVFRHGNKWFMVYVQLEDKPQGYTTLHAPRAMAAGSALGHADP